MNTTPEFIINTFVLECGMRLDAILADSSFVFHLGYEHWFQVWPSTDFKVNVHYREESTKLISSGLVSLDASLFETELKSLMKSKN